MSLLCLQEAGLVYPVFRCPTKNVNTKFKYRDKMINDFNIRALNNPKRTYDCEGVVCQILQFPQW